MHATIAPSAADARLDQVLDILASHALYRRSREARAERARLRQDSRRADRLLDRLITALVEARERAGLTQADVAARMLTTRSAISRLESGAYHRPSLTTIESYARAVGCHVELHIVSGYWVRSRARPLWSIELSLRRQFATEFVEGRRSRARGSPIE